MLISHGLAHAMEAVYGECVLAERLAVGARIILFPALSRSHVWTLREATCTFWGSSSTVEAIIEILLRDSNSYSILVLAFISLYKILTRVYELLYV